MNQIEKVYRPNMQFNPIQFSQKSCKSILPTLPKLKVRGQNGLMTHHYKMKISDVFRAKMKLRVKDRQERKAREMKAAIAMITFSKSEPECDDEPESDYRLGFDYNSFYGSDHESDCGSDYSTDSKYSEFEYDPQEESDSEF
jgi:hypothetical protein